METHFERGLENVYVENPWLFVFALLFPCGDGKLRAIRMMASSPNITAIGMSLRMPKKNLNCQWIAAARTAPVLPNTSRLAQRIMTCSALPGENIHAHIV